MISIILVCVVAACVNAKASMPARCCSPPSYTALVMENGGLIYNGEPQAVDFTTKVTYDYNERMIRMDRKGYDKDLNPVEYTLLLDYHKGLTYYIKDAVCMPSPVLTNMLPPCMPESAVFAGRNVIGSFGSHLSVDSWYLQDGNSTYTISVTSDDCLPFAETIKMDNKGVTLMQSMIVTNVTLGPVDQSLLSVPSSCNS